MSLFELFLIAVGLSMDAFAVSVCKGLSVRRVRPAHALTCGGYFGLFQGMMPLIGWLLGVRFQNIIVSIDHWIAFGLLVLIGLNMIRETIWGDDEEQNSDFGVRTMLVMAIATSIDALAVGVSMAFLNVNVWISAAVICIITLIISAVGVYLGTMFGTRLGSKAGIIGGLILIAIGIKIVVEHVWL